jgi:fatty acid synthase, animal type
VNCIRKEPKGENLRCMFINDDSAPEFDLNHDFYQSQLSLGLPLNVFYEGSWGTYRHLSIDEGSLSLFAGRDDHNSVECLVKGDLSSLKWIKGSQSYQSKSNIVNLQYTSLNFRDVMIATGKIHLPFTLGMEFSGVTSEGKRVMGITPMGALSTQVDSRRSFIFDVPDNWTLEEAATVTTVNCTIYLAFFIIAKIKKGESILIHSGTGGVGLAAIQVALSYGLDVFTTVGTEEKRNFLIQRFQSLKPNQIGNSRDTSFERMIKMETNGKGVNYVLNSLSDDKLQASLRCLARHGTFLEIGKYDIMNKSKFDMGLYNNRIVFRGVFFDDYDYLTDEIQVSFNFH